MSLLLGAFDFFPGGELAFFDFSRIKILIWGLGER